MVGEGRLLLLTGEKEKVAGACAWLEVCLVGSVVGEGRRLLLTK